MSKEEIDTEYKKLIEELRHAYNNNNITLFIGSGCSLSFGYPSWNELLLKYLEKKIENDSNILDKLKFYLKREEKENLTIEELKKDLNSNKIDLLKFAQFLNNVVEPRDGLKSYISESIIKVNKDLEKKDKIKDKYGNNYLDRCKKIKNIITTNYDNVIEETFKKNFGIYNNTPFRGKSLKIDKYDSKNINILKIHGDCNQNKEIVITEEDYHNFESTDDYMYSKMKVLFRETTVIFSGYSMDDLDLRRFLYKYKKFDEGNKYYISYDFMNNELRKNMEKDFKIKILNKYCDGLTLDKVFADIESIEDFSKFTDEIIEVIEKNIIKGIDIQKIEKLMFELSFTENDLERLYKKLNKVGEKYFNGFYSSRFSNIFFKAHKDGKLDINRFDAPIIAKIIRDIGYEEGGKEIPEFPILFNIVNLCSEEKRKLILKNVYRIEFNTEKLGLFTFFYSFGILFEVLSGENVWCAVKDLEYNFKEKIVNSIRAYFKEKLNEKILENYIWIVLSWIEGKNFKNKFLQKASGYASYMSFNLKGTELILTACNDTSSSEKYTKIIDLSKTTKEKIVFKNEGTFKLSEVPLGYFLNKEKVLELSSLQKKVINILIKKENNINIEEIEEILRTPKGLVEKFIKISNQQVKN